jgi:probable HAF family extracellular repeat protein
MTLNRTPSNLCSSSRLGPGAGALALLAVVGAALAQPTFTPLGVLPSSGQKYSDVWGLSGDGSTVVGASIVSGQMPFGPTYAAYRWTAQTGMVNIYGLSGIGTDCHAYGTNFDGTVVVGMASYGQLSPTYIVAFVWTLEGGTVEIGDLPGGPNPARAAARGVSANGVIVAGQGESDLGAEPFRYDFNSSTWLGLGDLPGGLFGGSAYGISADSNTIVGSSIVGPDPDRETHAFRWTQAEGMVDIGYLPVPSGVVPFSEAYGANADGTVIVGLTRSMLSSNNGWEAFRWTQATGMVGLGDLPGGAVLSEGYATTADGSIVVGKAGILGNCGPFGCQTAPRAFIWDAQNGLRDLNDALPTMGVTIPAGWTLTEARGISANGRVLAGTGTDVQGNYEGWRVDLGPLTPPCYANCDGSTTAPVLNVADFTCFLQKYAAADPYANCDGSTTQPILNVGDFTCFLQKFAAGCQ